MATEIKVGLAGFGNVGKGTYDILERNHSLIRQRAGAPISVKRVTVRNVDRVKLLVDEDVIVTNDWHDLVMTRKSTLWLKPWAASSLQNL